MSEWASWIVAEAEKTGYAGNIEFLRRRAAKENVAIEKLPTHAFPGKKDERAIVDVVQNATRMRRGEDWGKETYDERDRMQRIYRSRTVGMLRRYMRYSIETGRLPSMVGREFFRSKVTSYRVSTFEDRVIFVHDMDTCLRKLDDLSREVLARVVLQEYGHEDAARLIGCARMTVHRRLIEALDELSRILVEVGILTRLDSDDSDPCQAEKEGESLLSDCEREE